MVDDLERLEPPTSDCLNITIQGVHPRSLASDDVHDGPFEFVSLADRNIRFDVHGLRMRR